MKEANQSLQTMTTAVTCRAAHAPRQLRSCLIYKALGKNMKSTPSAKKLELACRAMLDKHAIKPTEIKGFSDVGFWFLEVKISDRKFTFGSNGREGYSFSEIKDGKEIIYIGSDSEPIFGPNDLLWKRSFEIIRSALKDPSYRGQPPIPII